MNSNYEQAASSLTTTIVTILKETQGVDPIAEDKERVAEAVNTFVDFMRKGALEELSNVFGKKA